jgi:HEAT repeat protein
MDTNNGNGKKSMAPTQEVVAVHDSLTSALLAALDSRNRSERDQAINQQAKDGNPDDLVAVMGDGAHSRRRNAAMEALSRGGQRSVPALLRALRSDDPELVMFAANVLGRTRDPAAVPHLVVLLEHPDANVAQAAIDALAQLRATMAVDSLVKALDRDPWLRFSAVEALGEIGDVKAVGPLVGLLADESIRLSAIEALGKIGSVEALGALARLLRENEDSRTFAACLRAIGRALESQPDERTLRRIESWAHLGSAEAAQVQERLVQVLTGGEEIAYGSEREVSEKEAVAQLVRALRLRPLYATLVLAGRDPALREVLQFCAVSIGDEIAPALGDGLDCSNRNVRVLACNCIGTLGLVELVPGLIELLQDPDEGIRAAAVSALTRLRHADAIRSIVKLLGDKSQVVREAVLAALTQLDASLVSDALLRECSARPALRSLALDVMRVNPHVNQLGFLRDCVAARDPLLRAKAMAVITTQLGAQVVDFLRPLLADSELEARRSIVVALGQIRNPTAIQLLLQQVESDPATRPEAIRSLIALGDVSAAPRLLEFLERFSGQERLPLVEALAHLVDPAAEPVLVRLLVDEDPAMRQAAIKALGHFSSRIALRHLVAAGRDSDPGVRVAVAEMLAVLGDPEAREALERMCADPDPTVAATARRLAGPVPDGAP